MKTSLYIFIFLTIPQPPISTLFPYTTLFRSAPRPLRGRPPSRACGRTLMRCHEHARSEEHTSELQSLRHLVCRLLLEKKKKINIEYDLYYINYMNDIRRI